MRIACLIIATFVLSAAAQEPTFAKDIVPVFEKYCIGCHTSSVKLGSLDLSTFEGLQKGGNHGQIVVPGKPAESRLYTMVAGLSKPSMPMDGSKLAQGELDVLKRW